MIFPLKKVGRQPTVHLFSKAEIFSQKVKGRIPLENNMRSLILNAQHQPPQITVLQLKLRGQHGEVTPPVGVFQIGQLERQQKCSQTRKTTPLMVTAQQ